MLEQLPDRTDRISLRRSLVVTVALNPRKSQRHAGRVLRALLNLVDRDFHDEFGADMYDVLVTPVAISYMLSQIALSRELAAIFTELSRVGGPQIALRTEYVLRLLGGELGPFAMETTKTPSRSPMDIADITRAHLSR